MGAVEEPEQLGIGVLLFDGLVDAYDYIVPPRSLPSR